MSQEIPSNPPASREAEFTPMVGVGAFLIAALISAAYPYVVLKIGSGPNASVVAAFLGALFLSIAARGQRNSLRNNVIQTAGTSAAATAFMCIVAAAFGYIGMNESVDVHVTIRPWHMFGWLTLAGVIGVLASSLFRRMFVEDKELVFADGVAAAETIRVLDKPAGAGNEAKTLAISSVASAVVHGVVEGAPAVAGKILVPYLMFNAPFKMGLDWSLLTIGSGLLVGLRVGASMLAGALVLWFVVGPWVMDGAIAQAIVFDSVAPANLEKCQQLHAFARAGVALPDADATFFSDRCGEFPRWASDDHFRIVMLWAMWPATSLMVASAVTGVAIRWRLVADTFRRLRSPGGATNGGQDVSPRTVVILCSIGAVALAALQSSAFGMSYMQSFVAIAASLPLMLVGIRVLGETNQGPISLMANSLQAVFAAVWPASLAANLASAGIAGSIAAQSQGTIQDYKTGQILGSTPRILTWVQVAAVPIGAAAVAIMYPLLVNTYGLGKGLSAPTGLKLANMAVLMSKGIDALPPHALTWTVIAAVVGVVLELLVAFTTWGKFLPSAAGFGFSLILPGTLNIPMGLAGIAGWAWERRSKETYDRYVVTLASGLIAGEALLGGVAIPVLLTWLAS